MDALGIQAKINRGASIANRYLGTAFAQYRPRGAGNPLAPANRIGTVAVSFLGTRPNLAEKPVWEGLFDWTGTAVGDYLVGREGAFFISAEQFQRTTPLVCCNRVLTFSRPGSAPPGPDYYSGDVTATEAALLTAWPAAVVPGIKSQAGDVNLPGDARLPWIRIMMPATAVQIRTSDFAVDDQAQPMRYEVSSAVQTVMGWQLTASMAMT